MAENSQKTASQTPPTHETAPGAAAAQPTDWQGQVQYLRHLANIVKDQGLAELEVQTDGVRLHLKAPSSGEVTAYAAPVAPAAPVQGGAPRSGAAPARKAKPGKGVAGEGQKTGGAASGLVDVVSPMVGVFYRAPSPSDPNFVELGDRVERGQTIGLVEAMKVFNEIVAESSGTVAEIVANSGELVETGAALIRLRA